MNTTLQISDTVWNHAVEYAKVRGEQLSTIVERYLMSLEIPQKANAEISAEVKELIGILPRSAKEWKEEKAEYLQEKHL